MAVVRFPHAEAPDDDGWHVDAGMDGTVALGSPDRALLMLFLLSDVGAEDGPTRIRVGSHRVVPGELVDGPVGFMDLAARVVPRTEHLPEALATGDAGDVYLCHPFLVHAAQAVRSARVRFMTQPPLPPAGPLRPDRPAGERSPVERAVAGALGAG
jgi:ectoine hydroxylase-related dioxygenase (phytanoyl-CoA dioxygenase family)